MIHLHPARWKHLFSSKEFLKDFLKNLLSSFGALWLIAEMASFFSVQAKDWLISRWWLFLLAGIVWSVYTLRPKTSFKYKVHERDVIIELKIADAFDVDGALVISCSTTFDTDLEGKISTAPSIQGKFLRDYYDGNVEHLDLDIQAQISKEQYQHVIDDKKKIGKKERYETGCVIQLIRKNRKFYLLALTDISSDGRARSSEDDLKNALPRLWYYISEKGDKGDVVIPLLGTGHARIPITREEVFKIIVRSFVASCSSRNYCDKLSIVIFPKDVIRYKIDIERLNDFLLHECLYAGFEDEKYSRIGTAIE